MQSLVFLYIPSTLPLSFIVLHIHTPFTVFLYSSSIHHPLFFLLPIHIPSPFSTIPHKHSIISYTPHYTSSFFRLLPISTLYFPLRSIFSSTPHFNSIYFSSTPHPYFIHLFLYSPTTLLPHYCLDLHAAFQTSLMASHTL